MRNILVSVFDRRVQLDCSDFDLDDDVIVDSVSAVTELLTQILRAARSKALLTDATLEGRIAGIAAQDMIVQASILQALLQARILEEITLGRSSISDYGFPEFQETNTFDV
jgi:hypothetical protein